MRILTNKCYVEVHWQVTNPELNILDLCVWMAIQSKVEEIHKLLTIQHDVLSESIRVYIAFDKFVAEVLSKIHKRWSKVLHIFMSKVGDNKDMKKYHGDAAIIDLTDWYQISTYIQTITDGYESTH